LGNWGTISPKQRIGNRFPCSLDELQRLAAESKVKPEVQKSGMPHRGYVKAPTAPPYGTLEAKPRQRKPSTKVKVWVRNDALDRGRVRSGTVTRRVARDPEHLDVD
jgi:hypothetical protein